MSNEENEEKSNPFEGYSSFLSRTPYEYLEQRAKYDQFEAGNACYNTDVKFRTEPILRFTPRPMTEMVKEFFRRDGRPQYTRLGDNVAEWILWSVTEGRYRIDRMRRVFAFKGIEAPVLSLKAAKRWVRVHPEYGDVSMLDAITETCNQLSEQILIRLKAHNSSSRMFKNCLFNFRNLPEFVSTQRDRTYEQKNYRVGYQPIPQAGAAPDSKACKSTPNAVQSVHRYLYNYHIWCDPLKKKT